MSNIRDRVRSDIDQLYHKVKASAEFVLPPIVPAAARMLVKQANSFAAPQTRIKFKYGDFVLQCDSSHHLPQILESLPEYGRNLADLVLALNVQTPRIIDIGANIGDTAVLLARFAPGARILCVEGDPRFMCDLISNTSQISGVTIAHAILSDKTCEVSGTFFKHKGTAHVELDKSGHILTMRTLDCLLDEYSEFSHPHVIKIDTDGFDPAILRGAKEILTTADRPIVFYEWDPYSYGMAGEDDTGHADFLRDLGYDRFLIFTNKGQLLLHLHQPGHEVWHSLGDFSRRRHTLDGWHYDVVGFPPGGQDVCERLIARSSSFPIL